MLSAHRYYAPLRLPSALLGSLRFSLSLPNTLTHFLLLCAPVPLLRLVDIASVELANARSLDQPVHLVFWQLGGKQYGSLEFPNYPFRYMPRS